MYVRPAIVLFTLLGAAAHADPGSAGWSLGLNCRPKGTASSGTAAASTSGGFTGSGTCARTDQKFVRIDLPVTSGGTLHSTTVYGIHTPSMLVLPPLLDTESQPVFAVASACPTATTTRNLNWLFVQWTDEERQLLQNTYVLGTATYHHQSGIYITGQYDVTGALYYGGARPMPGSCNPATGIYNISTDIYTDINGNVYFTAGAMGVFKTQAGRATFFFPQYTVNLANDFGGKSFRGLNFDSASANGIGDVRYVTASANGAGTVITVEALNATASAVDGSGTAYTDTITFTATNAPSDGALRANVTRAGFGAGTGILACIANREGGDLMLLCSGRSPADNQLPYSLTLYAENVYSRKAGPDWEAYSIAVDNATGRTYLAGEFEYVGERASPALAAFDAGGTFDTAWVSQGLYSSVDSFTPRGAFVGNGHLYVGGDFNNTSLGAQGRIARFSLTTGALDTTFSIGSGFNNHVRSIAFDSVTNDIYAGGRFTNFAGTGRVRLARINSNGSIDTGFTVGTGFTGGGTPQVDALLWDGVNSRLYAGGAFTSYNGNGRARLVKLDDTGAEDTSFGIGTGFTGGAVQALALDTAGGRLYVAGAFTNYNGAPVGRILRLNMTTGAFDAVFATGTGFDAAVTTLLFQGGKLYVGGDFTDYDGTAVNRIVRLNTDGSIDTAFDPGTGFDASVRSLAYDTGNAELHVAGAFELYDGTPVQRVVALNADGTVAAGYPRGGGFNRGIFELALDPASNKLYVGGLFSHFDGASSNRIVRLNEDGSRDTTFNVGTGYDSAVTSMAWSAALNRLWVSGGGSVYDGTPVNYLGQLKNDGSLDTAFQAAAGLGPNGAAFDMVIDPATNDVYAVGNFTEYDSVPSGNIVRINADGTRDGAFAVGVGFNDDGNSVVLDTLDGKLYVGGIFATYQGAAVPRIARLNLDGSLDTSFNPGSGADDGNVVAIALDQTRRKLYVGGEYTTFNGGGSAYLVRLELDGSIDTTFDLGAGFSSFIWSIQIEETTGKIYVAGNFSEFDGDGAINYVARLNYDGSRDTTWGNFSNNDISAILFDAARGMLYIGGNVTNHGLVSVGRGWRTNYFGFVD